MNILNILNGDATADVFARTALEGDVLVWREFLSAGPVAAELSTNDFFRQRAGWVASELKITETKYYKTTVKEFRKIENEYEHIILWFEYDLHCQVNVLFLLHYLHLHCSALSRITLVCPESHPAHPDFRGLGELTPEELAPLVDTGIEITTDMLLFASKAWIAYCSGDREPLEALMQENNGALPAFDRAMTAQLDRIPLPGETVSALDREIIALVGDGSLSRTDIFVAFSTRHKIYGFGDREFFLLLDRLETRGLIPETAR